MAFMTTITHSPAVKFSHRDKRGFTMVELLISATLGSILLLGVTTAFLFLGRSGVNMQNYADMEVQARRAIETFSEDTRMASDATWTKSATATAANILTLTVVTSSGATKTCIYTYNPTLRTFTRQLDGVTTTLITGIASFTFTAYKINAATISLTDDATLVDAGKFTKQVQISLRTIRSNRTVTDATNAVISARFILRNKTVTA